MEFILPRTHLNFDLCVLW